MSAIYWFEIPAAEIERARDFYAAVLGVELTVYDMTEEMGSKLVMLPDRGGVGGALVENSEHGYLPSESGSLLYLSVDGEMEETLARVEPAGGAILLPKTPLGDQGFTAWIRDTEGNRVGLRSPE